MNKKRDRSDTKGSESPKTSLIKRLRGIVCSPGTKDGDTAQSPLPAPMVHGRLSNDEKSSIIKEAIKQSKDVFTSAADLDLQPRDVLAFLQNDLGFVKQNLDKVLALSWPDGASAWAAICIEAMQQGNVTLLEKVRINKQLGADLSSAMAANINEILNVLSDDKFLRDAKGAVGVLTELKNKAWGLDSIALFEAVHGHIALHRIVKTNNVKLVVSFVGLFNVVYPLYTDARSAIVFAAGQNNVAMVEQLLSFYWPVPDEAMLNLCGKITDHNFKKHIMARMPYIIASNRPKPRDTQGAAIQKYNFTKHDEITNSYINGRASAINAYKTMFNNNPQEAWSMYVCTGEKLLSKNFDVGQRHQFAIHESFIWAVMCVNEEALEIRRTVDKSIADDLKGTDDHCLKTAIISKAADENGPAFFSYFVSKWVNGKEKAYSNLFAHALTSPSVTGNQCATLFGIIKDYMTREDVHKVISQAMDAAPSASYVDFVKHTINVFATEDVADDDFMGHATFLTEAIIKSQRGEYVADMNTLFKAGLLREGIKENVSRLKASFDNEFEDKTPPKDAKDLTDRVLKHGNVEVFKKHCALYNYPRDLGLLQSIIQSKFSRTDEWAKQIITHLFTKYKHDTDASNLNELQRFITEQITYAIKHSWNYLFNILCDPRKFRIDMSGHTKEKMDLLMRKNIDIFLASAIKINNGHMISVLLDTEVVKSHAHTLEWVNTLVESYKSKDKTMITRLKEKDIQLNKQNIHKFTVEIFDNTGDDELNAILDNVVFPDAQTKKVNVNRKERQYIDQTKLREMLSDHRDKILNEFVARGNVNSMKRWFCAHKKYYRGKVPTLDSSNYMLIVSENNEGEIIEKTNFLFNNRLLTRENISDIAYHAAINQGHSNLVDYWIKNLQIDIDKLRERPTYKWNYPDLSREPETTGTLQLEDENKKAVHATTSDADASSADVSSADALSADASSADDKKGAMHNVESAVLTPVNDAGITTKNNDKGTLSPDSSSNHTVSELTDQLSRAVLGFPKPEPRPDGRLDGNSTTKAAAHNHLNDEVVSGK